MHIQREKTTSGGSSSSTAPKQGIRSASQSSSGSSNRKWPWRPFGSKSGFQESQNESDRVTPKADVLSGSDKSPGSPKSPTSAISNSDETNYQQLLQCVQRMRSTPPGTTPNHIDAAYREYSKLRDKARALCQALSKPGSQYPGQFLSGPLANGDSRRTSSIETASLTAWETRSSQSPRSSTDHGQTASSSERYFAAIRDWQDCLEHLGLGLRTSLLNTFKEYEPNATPAMEERLFTDKNFRQDAIYRMRNASIARMVSANLDFFPRYRIRFGYYRELEEELVKTRFLLQAGESGISPERKIETIVISERGDAILEFANNASENYPVLRFRVSSHTLVETSSIFRIMFRGGPTERSDDISAGSLPPQPTKYICKDGTEARLYRMPQIELNTEGALETLLHAAHMHNHLVPREVSFKRFVAIAEVCFRYQCTSPLEFLVEMRWLPRWTQDKTEARADGLLLISYVFGLRDLFTEMSRMAILNVVNKRDLESKPWPQKVKDKIWAVRSVKTDQVYAYCTSSLQEYLQTPPENVCTRHQSCIDSGELVPTISPRCPQSSHLCDASSLGWLTMIFNELQILPHVMRPDDSFHSPPPQRSLKQLIDSLRFMSSPPQNHGGVCDYAPAFRSAMMDLYNSVAGLTLYDIAGLHGWALSKQQANIHEAYGDQPKASPGKKLAGKAELRGDEPRSPGGDIRSKDGATTERQDASGDDYLVSPASPRSSLQPDIAHKTTGHISWPYGNLDALSPPASPPSKDTQKVRAGDLAFSGSEEKSLVFEENKCRREDHEQRLEGLSPFGDAKKKEIE